MATLVELEDAKGHLKVTGTGDDADIEAKLEEATDIVLDYLDVWSGRVAVIESSSAANPTVITTKTAHGYSSGETVTIAGHADSDPGLDGSYTATVVSGTTFTVPVSVLTAGTGGLASVAWDESTAPARVKAAIKVMLAHLYENRGDDQKADEDVWKAIGRLLARTRDPALA